MVKQCTIGREISCSGIGLHTGKVNKAIFKPAAPNYGIKFVRTDLKEKFSVSAVYENVLGIARGTTIGIDNVIVYTVEHLLSALYGLGIDNLEIDLDNNEPPVFDGSSEFFVKTLLKAGVVEQGSEREYITLKEPVVYRSENENNSVEITAYPSDELKIDFKVDYNHPLVGKQQIALPITKDSFIKDIAPSRTFCFDFEIEPIKKQGLAKGGRLENTVVVGIDRIHNPGELKYKDEFVRHKVLDLLGDMYLLGKPLKAHIVAVRSGHAHNINFVKKIAGTVKPEKSKISHSISKDRQEFNTDEIKSVIPHREPFLMIDRVVISWEEKSATGYKHLTGKEDFFRGHFPGNPIMPGVLIVEAMAQTACVLILSRPEHRGKIAYFVTIDKVKFRKPVLPGDVLELKIQGITARGRSGKARAEAFVKGNLVTESEFMFMLGEKK
jgi:UDP-3-O-[3-hydroxymyristoyl] N-acetylglucosamine deacetylase/3-hydroxyacyl-[acyl-carrier-protein] dehydratase